MMDDQEVFKLLAFCLGAVFGAVVVGAIVGLGV
jgi:hypothetical protein